jgi:hypothetical protein
MNLGLLVPGYEGFVYYLPITSKCLYLKDATEDSNVNFTVKMRLNRTNPDYVRYRQQPAGQYGWTK